MARKLCCYRAIPSFYPARYFRMVRNMLITVNSINMRAATEFLWLWSVIRNNAVWNSMALGKAFYKLLRSSFGRNIVTGKVWCLASIVNLIHRTWVSSHTYEQLFRLRLTSFPNAIANFIHGVRQFFYIFWGLSKVMRAKITGVWVVYNHKGKVTWVRLVQSGGQGLLNSCHRQSQDNSHLESPFWILMVRWWAT